MYVKDLYKKGFIDKHDLKKEVTIDKKEPRRKWNKQAKALVQFDSGLSLFIHNSYSISAWLYLHATFFTNYMFSI